MTREECARKLEQLIKDKGYINDATVKVDFQDAHITVLGAISGGVISLTSERTSSMFLDNAEAMLRLEHTDRTSGFTEK